MTKKIVFICNDVIGSTMAGPGIRAWEMAHALQMKGHQTVILSRHLEKDFAGGNISFVGKASFVNLLVWIWRCDWIIQPGRPLSILLAILFRKRIIFDQYDPVIFEFLEHRPVSPVDRALNSIMLFLWKVRQRIILRFGQSFLVANDKQKDFLLGQLAILGHRGKLDRVTVLPFGLPEGKPVKTRSVLRGTKIKDTDFLLVWGGGIWGWFDPFTLLKALVTIATQRKDIKVYFPGIKPPSPESRKMAVTDDFISESRALGLLDTTVFINSGWTSYEQRADYLLEANAGISLHRESLECRFAFRTRMLDYLWAGLPIIASKGDSWADEIQREDLGITVPCNDVDAVTRAIVKMADDTAFRARCCKQARSVADEYAWGRLVKRLEAILS